MRTLRNRASRGNSVPDQQPQSQTDANATTMSAGNATTPQESIEAKPGVDEDVEMKDAGAADADADAEGEPDADADADGDVDAEGEPDDDTVPAASRPNRDQRDLLQLIETTAHTFSSYEEE